MEMQAEQRAMRAEDEDAMEAEAAGQLTAQQLQAGINAAQDADLPTIMRALTKKGRNLLGKLSHDEADEHGRTPLWKACYEGHVDAARLLLEKGAEVDKANEWGGTPLYAACWKGHVDAARLLLDKGAEVDRANKYLNKFCVTPLHIACQNGHVEAVRLLLDNGAAVDRVDRADKYGVTPLYIAKYQGHSSIVALLEYHLYKADIDATAPVATQTRGKNLANMMVDRLQSALDDEAARKRQRLGPRADMGRRLPRAGSDPRGRVAPAIRAAPAQIPEGTFVI